jgi:murein DD-endopeptidase MepM/ murein hydrolase activator NlpD
MRRRPPIRDRQLGPGVAATAALVASLVLAAPACDDRTVPTRAEPEICGPYPNASASPYRLPIPVGESSLITQGNCGPFTHAGLQRHAYDFDLEVGSTLVAMRAGEVIELEESFVDVVADAINEANFVRIRHADGTVAAYVHLMHEGVLVGLGSMVSAGQPIAFSGVTGFTNGFPHLHLVVFGCEDGCDSIPVTFNNASPAAPDGLQAGVVYTALPPP